ncbi:ABC transporter permease [Luedemannella flava]|uniref:ABC transporter permease n=1 Tax=Luedemannella flava TaxID=349316 RepID=UPI0031CFF880
MATVAGAGASGTAAGYTSEQLLTFCWVTQGLIGVVALWGWNELGERIRTGAVVADLLRPISPVTSYLAVDLGRAGVALITRFVVPVAVGALFFDLYVPHRPATYPIFAVSVLLGVIVCFGCRFLLNATGYWLLDLRGITVVWLVASGLLAGLTFPLPFLPDWAVTALWVLTPLPSIMQGPLDILVERGDATRAGLTLAAQSLWAVVLLLICGYVQRRAERKLVIQGG